MRCDADDAGLSTNRLVELVTLGDVSAEVIPQSEDLADEGLDLHLAVGLLRVKARYFCVEFFDAITGKILPNLLERGRS